MTISQAHRSFVSWFKHGTYAKLLLTWLTLSISSFLLLSSPFYTLTILAFALLALSRKQVFDPLLLFKVLVLGVEHYSRISARRSKDRNLKKRKKINLFNTGKYQKALGDNLDSIPQTHARTLQPQINLYIHVPIVRICWQTHIFSSRDTNFI